MTSVIDSVVVNAPQSGSALRLQKEYGEIAFRYVSLTDFLNEVSATIGLDTNVANYTITPAGGQAGTLTAVNVLDANQADASSSGKRGEVLVIADQGGGSDKSQRYSILCPLTDGQVREVIVQDWCVKRSF